MRQLLLVTLTLITITAFAQRKKGHYPLYKVPTAGEILADNIAQECFYNGKYSKAERRNIYPFKNASQVVLISFNEFERIPIENKLINKSRVLEQTVLGNEQTDSLTSILYNIGFTPIPRAVPSVMEGGCYEPRNAVLFMNAAGKAFEYIEICFACHRTTTSSKKVVEGDYCATKLDLLKTFFFNANIKYGTGISDSPLSYRDILKLDTIEILWTIQEKLNTKTGNGENLTSLSDIERTLFYAINANQIYRSNSFLSGFAEFYLYNSGNYYSETLLSLEKIGAPLLSAALKLSAKQWPQAQIPTSLSTRRALLLQMINKTEPAWKKLNDSLYNSHKMVGGVELTKKEDLDKLVLNYIYAHRTELID
jgi:hypothetical protein